MSVVVVWYQLLSEVLVDFSAAAFLGAVVAFPKWLRLQPPEFPWLVVGNLVTGVVVLLLAFVLRTLTI